jgi:hypothetical protein
VFLDLPSANRTTSTDDPHFAGSFAFFGTPEPSTRAATGADHKTHPEFLVNITNTLQNLKRNQELREGAPISVQLVAVPFAGKFEREDTQLSLERIDIITTPVIINSRE